MSLIPLSPAVSKQRIDRDDKNKKSVQAAATNSMSTTAPTTIPMHLIKSTTSQSLKHGMMYENKKGGPGGRYVLVPAGWRKPSEEYVASIFAALSIPIPPLIFETDKCPKLFPDIGLVKKFDEEGADPFSAFQVKSEGATQSQIELFGVVMKARMISIVREITEACVQCNAIYAMFNPIYLNKFDKIITDGLPTGGVALGIPRDGVMPPAMKQVMMEHAVPLSEEVLQAVQWTDGPIKTADEQYSSDIPVGQSIPHLNLDLTHLLLFEDEKDRDYFSEMMSKEIPLGLLCAGGTLKLFRKSVQAISRGTPLFVFKHTLRTGHCFSSLLDHYNDTQNPDLPLSQVKSIESRLNPAGKDHYMLMQDMRERTMALAYNWPSDYNADSILHIDPLVEHPKKLLLGIINVMSSVHGSSSELGGGMAEREAIQQAYKMSAHLKLMENHQLHIATALKSLSITLALLITSCACTSLYMRLHHDYLLEEHSMASIILRAGNIGLPILLGVCVTMYTAFAPLNKWAMLTMARAQVDSESYRYLCRVGEYKATRTGADHRVRYAINLQTIWESVATADVVGNFDKVLTKKANKEVATFFKSPLSRFKKGNFKIDPNPNAKMGDEESGTSSPVQPTTVASLETKKDKSEDSQEKADKVPPFQLMSGDDYIERRVRSQMQRLETETPTLNSRLSTLQVLIIIASSAGAVFAMYNQEVWIPILLGLASFIDSIINFWQLKLKSQRAGFMYTQLKKTLLWWNGLTIIQQRVPFYKGQLVDTVENIILTEVEMLTQAQVKRTDDGDTAEHNNLEDTVAAQQGNGKKDTTY